MAHGLNSVIKRGIASANCKSEGKGIGSRRIFAPHFKLQVLDSYRNDADCKGNQRATARKYGIHRRQIQKWLQVENTLRNTVSAKEKSGNGDHVPEVRKCESDSAALGSGRQRDDERVPTLAHGCPAPLDFTTRRPPPPDPSAPMDLSLKRPTSPQRAPVCRAPLPAPPASPGLARPHPDVWDLSTRGGQKRKCDTPPLTSPKPVKLFKPYLDEPKAAAPCCDFYNNNNNNDLCYNTYTLLELQPKSSCYYYPPYPSYDYEVAGGYCGVYEDVYGQGMAPLKQRQSYSLDFKLSAIDCYYQDSVCKGNQRAVATKYNVHRRQVQKWLKQAEELRLRNETVKQIHAVR